MGVTHVLFLTVCVIDLDEEDELGIYPVCETASIVDEYPC